LTNGLGEVTGGYYGARGRANRKTVAPGQFEDYTYDVRGRVSGVTLRNSWGTALRSQLYTFDISGEALSHTVDGLATRYPYDLAGQLTGETRPGYAAS